MGGMGLTEFRHHVPDHFFTGDAVLRFPRSKRTVLFHKSLKILDEHLALPGGLPRESDRKGKFHSRQYLCDRIQS